MLIEIINLDQKQEAESAFIGRLAEALGLSEPLVIDQSEQSACQSKKALNRGWGDGAARMAKWLPLGEHRQRLKDSIESESCDTITVNHALTMVLADKGAEGPVFSIVPLEACCGSALPDLSILIDGNEADLATLNGLNQNVISVKLSEIIDEEYDFTQMKSMIEMDYLREMRRTPEIMDDFSENLFKLEYIDANTREPLFFDFLRLPSSGVSVSILNEETFEVEKDIDVKDLEIGMIVSVTPPGENTARVIGRLVDVTPVNDLEPPTVEINAHQELSGYLEAVDVNGRKVRQLVQEGDSLFLAETKRPVTLSELLNMQDDVLLYHPLHSHPLTVSGLTPALPSSAQTQAFVQVLAGNPLQEYTFTTKVFAGDEVTALDPDGNEFQAIFDTEMEGGAGSIMLGDRVLTESSTRFSKTAYHFYGDDQEWTLTTTVNTPATVMGQVRGPSQDKLKIAYKMSDAVDRVGEVDACALMVVLPDPKVPEVLTYTQVINIKPGALLYNSDGKGSHNYFLVTDIG